MKGEKTKLTRRGFLGLAIVIMGTIHTGAGSIVRAAQKFFEDPPPEIPLQKRLDEILSGAKGSSGLVKMEIADLAEDGSVVPIGVKLDLSSSDYAKVDSVYLIADKNPDPLLASFKINPAHGVSMLETRIRLRETTRVAAYCRTSDGKVFMAEAKVEVTAGGCA
ncbi:MAG: thiosulfate oxidation carrier protein SoxY [Deltaproteobacteria bacterium]|nr:thiosulfate oxidation carrier protein SoxY [Deltaproteobacteria bacterium]